MHKTIKPESASAAFLHQIGDARWTSRRTLDLYPVSSDWVIRSIKRLQDEGLVSFKAMKDGRRYRLREKGYSWLLENNPDRFRDRTRSMVTDGEYAEDKVRRISLIGETCAMAELAGYSVHPDDKPDIRVLSASLEQEKAIPASAAPLPNTAPIPDTENGIHNSAAYSYYCEADRRSFATRNLDISEYRYRSTPVGCYYPVRELRQLADQEVLEGGGTIFDLDAIVKFSKISGLLFTHDGGYRVFSTEHTAMRLRPSGESAMRSYLEDWCGNVYKRSLEAVFGEAYSGTALRGSILFGDKSHRAAVSVLRETWRREFRGSRRQEARTAASRNFNLVDIRDVIFIPVLREALPLLAFMLLPQWDRELRSVGMSYLELADEVPIEAFYPGTGYYDGKLADGRELACILALDLNRMMQILSGISVDSPDVHILAMTWQRPFYRLLGDMLEPEKAGKITVDYVPTSFLLRCLNVRYRNLGYSGAFAGVFNL